MNVEQIPTTRSGLLQGLRRLARIERGIALLRRKREALVGELFREATPVVRSRAAIEGRAVRAYTALLRALARHGRDALVVLGWPLRPARLDLVPDQLWGVEVVRVLRQEQLQRTLDARGVAPGAAGPAAVEAADEFERFADELLEGLGHELRLRRLGAALAHTGRQVNTLERRLEPALNRRVAAVRTTLGEREREELVRLRHLRKRMERLRRAARS